MNAFLNWIKLAISSEPAIVWTSGGAAVVAAVQASPDIQQTYKNIIALVITLAVGAIIRQGVTPATPKAS
jgi:hypothetical protein